MITFINHLKIRGNMLVVYYVYCMLIVNILPISGNIGGENIENVTKWLHSPTGEQIFNTSGYISLGNLIIYFINNYGMKHVILLGLLFILFVFNIFIPLPKHWMNFIFPIIVIGCVCGVIFFYRYEYPLEGDKKGEYKGVSMESDIIILLLSLFGPILLIMFIMYVRNKEIINIKGIGSKGQLNTYVLSSIIMAGFVTLYLRWEGLKSTVENNYEAWKLGLINNPNWYFISVFSWIILGMVYGGFILPKLLSSNPNWFRSIREYHLDSVLLPSSSFLKGQDLISSLIIVLLTVIFLPMKKSILNKWYVLLLIWVHAFFSQDEYSESFKNFHKNFSNKLRDYEASHHPSVKDAINDEVSKVSKVKNFFKKGNMNMPTQMKSGMPNIMSNIMSSI